MGGHLFGRYEGCLYSKGPLIQGVGGVNLRIYSICAAMIPIACRLATYHLNFLCSSLSAHTMPKKDIRNSEQKESNSCSCLLGTPEIGGLTSIQGIEILRGCRGMNIVGGDMVEVRNKLTLTT